MVCFSNSNSVCSVYKTWYSSIQVCSVYQMFSMFSYDGVTLPLYHFLSSVSFNWPLREMIVRVMVCFPMSYRKILCRRMWLTVWDIYMSLETVWWCHWNFLKFMCSMCEKDCICDVEMMTKNIFLVLAGTPAIFNEGARDACWKALTIM